MRGLFAAVVLALLTCAGAQQQLSVNGTSVEVRTELVPGSAYAPAEAYARALGAEYRFDARTGVLLSFGGRFLSLRSFSTPAQAAAAKTALMVDGRRVPGTGAVTADGTVYLPVKSVTAALGGQTAYLTEVKTVAVVFPRPRLTAVSPPGAWGSYERFVLSFDAPVAVDDYFEPSLGAVRFRFRRAELGSDELSGRPFDLSGGRISDAAFVPSGNFLDFNLILQGGSSYRTFSEPRAEGERVVIDVFRNAAVGGAVGAQTPVLVLQTEAGTHVLAQRLKVALESRSIRVNLQRATPAAMDRAGFAAPFLLTLRQTTLPAGRFNVYYLPPDAAALDFPVRRGAVAAASDEARAQLARLAPAPALGERIARGLATGLDTRTSLTLGTLMAVPLQTLGSAAGRGVMLELSASDLNRSGLVAPLASLLSTLLQGR